MPFNIKHAQKNSSRRAQHKEREEKAAERSSNLRPSHRDRLCSLVFIHVHTV